MKTSALDGGKWSDSRPGRFTRRERAPGTPTGQEAGWTPGKKAVGTYNMSLCHTET